MTMSEYEKRELLQWLLDAGLRRVGEQIIAECQAMIDGDEDRAEAIRAELGKVDSKALAQASHLLIGALLFSADDPRELLMRAELRVIDRPDPPLD